MLTDGDREESLKSFYTWAKKMIVKPHYNVGQKHYGYSFFSPGSAPPFISGPMPGDASARLHALEQQVAQLQAALHGCMQQRHIQDARIQKLEAICSEQANWRPLTPARTFRCRFLELALHVPCPLARALLGCWALGDWPSPPQSFKPTLSACNRRLFELPRPPSAQAFHPPPSIHRASSCLSAPLELGARVPPPLTPLCPLPCRSQGPRKYKT